MKFNRKFFDRYRYKIDRDEHGNYNPYLRYKFWFKWRPMYEYADKLPLQTDEIINIEKSFITNHDRTFSSNIKSSGGFKTPEEAKEGLNAFIHCVNGIINESSDVESGSLKEFIVIENI